MAAAVASSPFPASRRLPSNPIPACPTAPSLLRLAGGSSRRLRSALRVSAAAEEADVLPGPGVIEREMVSTGLLEELPVNPLGGSQLDIGGLAFQGDMTGGFTSGGSGGAGTDGDGGNKMLDHGINTAILQGWTIS